MKSHDVRIALVVKQLPLTQVCIQGQYRKKNVTELERNEEKASKYDMSFSSNKTFFHIRSDIWIFSYAIYVIG